MAYGYGYEVGRLRTAGIPIGISAGFQSVSKFASVGNGANWAGIAAGIIQLGVDEYYAVDSERSIGRTAVINLTTKDGK